MNKKNILYPSTSNEKGKKQKYFTDNYKEKENSFPYESGRPGKKGIQAQNESELLYDDDGNAYYPEYNKKAEIKDVLSDTTAYNIEDEIIENIDTNIKKKYKWEEDLLAAIDNSQDDNEIPEGVEAVEGYNEIKERFDSEENEKYKKHTKYNQENRETDIIENFK